ncbi:unnamed protein product [Rotaria sordida]|uniref:Uncharacterized protein n=1 Tax=Rotaria sordida TaxID=392033 RepID=A0A813XIP6_9BILA|nr:unnamed protein product [Rotaria sordida]CAF0860776.1 unnamed protein product [Rotaria sordida]CAF0865819.1 unnamed protein product [Rotaria sordida]CAF0882299.1 unnamed protein product [Rotaria sordida]CAF3766413.1 unnamed protein product [Rotaria sordida]
MVRPPSSREDYSLSTDNTNTSFSSLLSESGEFTVTSNFSPLPHTTTITNISTELSSNRYPYVEQYLNIYYKKSLSQSMILATSQLVENTLALYDSMDDEAANSYILSFILLRVGCLSKTYDFEQFIDMNREEKDRIIKENWSGEKVLMNLTSKDDEIEKNYKRFEAFFSTLACLRFDDIIRINNETNLKKIIYLLIDDIQSTIVEYRFTILLALEAILRGLITTVAHGRRNKPGKISPFIGHKDATKIFEFVSMVFTKAIVPRLSDSESQIGHMAYQALIELCEIWPNSWISKEIFDECIYSIVSQDDKSDFNNSIRVFRTLLTHNEFEKESIRQYIQHFLIKISSDEFELLSVPNTTSIYKLINDILTIYPEMFSTKMIYHWSSGIFQDNNRTQKLALNYLLSLIQMNEDQFQSTTIWPYIIHVYVNIFKLNVSEETTACLIHSIENNSKISTILSNISGIEYYIETKIFDNSQISSILVILQLLRSLFILHINRQRTKMLINDEENDEEMICRNISKLTFKFITRIFQQGNINKSILMECLTALQTTLCSLPSENIRENSLSLNDLINEMRMMITTHQLADTSIDTDISE